MAQSPSTLVGIGFLAAINEDHLIVNCENDGSGNAIYIGKAKPGTADDDAGWQIAKCTYDANGSLLTKRWANGTPNLDKVWDNRADPSYVYS